MQHLYGLLETINSDHKKVPSLGSTLEEVQFMLIDMFTEGPNDYRVQALDELFQLPNFSPDDWVRRKYMIKGLHLSPQSKLIPQYLIDSFEESCYCFMYGNFMASIALARAVLEKVLKEQFPIFHKNKLDDIINKMWSITKGLKGHEDFRRKADYIRRAGNQALHKSNDKIAQIVNELTAKTVIEDLKSLMEFLYA